MILKKSFNATGVDLPSPTGAVGLHRLSLEPLRGKYHSDRSIVGECDRSRDWDSQRVGGHKQAGQHYRGKAQVVPLVEAVQDLEPLVN